MLQHNVIIPDYLRYSAMTQEINAKRWFCIPNFAGSLELRCCWQCFSWGKNFQYFCLKKTPFSDVPWLQQPACLGDIFSKLKESVCQWRAAAQPHLGWGQRGCCDVNRYSFNFNYNQQDATTLIYLFLKRFTCFRRFLRPSSGAHNCTYSFRYCQPVLPQAGIVDEPRYQPGWEGNLNLHTGC